MTQFTQTSTLETNRRKIPRPRKGDFNYYAAKEGALKVKGYNFGEKDVVLDRKLEGFSTVNPFGITDETTVIEAFNALTAGLSADLYQGTLDASGGIDYPAATIDQYWRISADGTIGTQIVEAGDMVICIADYAGGADDTKFIIVEKNISDISDLTDTEQLLDKMLSVTYAELVALRDASELIVGQNYLISDFAQSYNIFDGGTMDIIEEQIGEVEPIIVTASKVNELYKVAISTVYPQDIIHYSLDILDIRDVGFGNGVDTVNVNFKGQIYYRKDTIQNVETHYDFRNVRFRRWKVDAVAYDNGTAYNAKDVCKASDGKIYKCITATTGEGDPTINTADWVLWLDITADTFVSWTADKTAFNIGDITTDNLIINNVTAGADYDDFYTFGDYYNWVKNTHIGMIDLEYAIEEFGYATQLNNVVFKTIDDYDTCFGNNIGSNCLNNTIGNNFNSNTIGDDFRSNTIGDAFRSNTIGDGFKSNIIEDNFYSNTIGDDFRSNTIGNDFISNTIENGFNSNTIGNYFNSNTIGNNFYNTIFGDNCQYNTIANKINGANTNKIITFGDSITMCTIQDFAFGELAADLDLTAATHIRGAYN
ncbi:MAG TPA: hypothetical protein P5513_03650, partial [Candidatus Diapherotrites archaeon]|nr:hypothetical protein [Candidatus Diapherotrites archaeon]